MPKTDRQIRQNAEGNVAILTRQLQSLELIADQTANARRRKALRKQADLIADVAERTIPSSHDGAGVKAASECLFRVLDTPFQGHASPSDEKQEIA